MVPETHRSGYVQWNTHIHTRSSSSVVVVEEEESKFERRKLDRAFPEMITENYDFSYPLEKVLLLFRLWSRREFFLEP